MYLRTLFLDLPHLVFFFNVTPPTVIYTYCLTLSRHDALPISHHAIPMRILQQGLGQIPVHVKHLFLPSPTHVGLAPRTLGETNLFETGALQANICHVRLDEIDGYPLRLAHVHSDRLAIRPVHFFDTGCAHPGATGLAAVEPPLVHLRTIPDPQIGRASGGESGLQSE